MQTIHYLNMIYRGIYQKKIHSFLDITQKAVPILIEHVFLKVRFTMNIISDIFTFSLHNQVKNPTMHTYTST